MSKPSRSRQVVGDSRSSLNTIAAHELASEEALRPLNEFERRYAPKRLDLQGDLALLRRVKVSIVGSRRPSDDGLKRAAKLARELGRRDIVVVSGLALGIDSAAHRAAIDAGGRTVAVIGTPLDDVHPRSHRSLQEEIAKDHLVVSQSPLVTQCFSAIFPCVIARWR